MAAEHDKTARGNASQFYVAGELCRRGYAAVVTMGNTPNTDVLCSNRGGTRFVHIQVKTFVSGTSRTCSVGRKAERDFGPQFFWVLAGIPVPNSSAAFEYFIIPSADMAKNVKEYSRRWLETPGKDGRPHKDSAVRIVNVPPYARSHAWSIEEYRDRWDYIESILDD
jgi:hypothetical protein